MVLFYRWSGRAPLSISSVRVVTFPSDDGILWEAFHSEDMTFPAKVETQLKKLIFYKFRCRLDQDSNLHLLSGSKQC